jgi:hypothetical protein
MLKYYFFASVLEWSTLLFGKNKIMRFPECPYKCIISECIVLDYIWTIADSLTSNPVSIKIVSMDKAHPVLK